jgi:hypothetical protein
MPTTSTTGRESCRGQAVSGVGTFRYCLGVQRERAMAGTGPIANRFVWPQSQLANGLRRVAPGGYWPRWWENHQSEDEADAAGAELPAMLCVGCNRRRLRLIEEGAWTP